jgi:hypothetical protein
MKKKDVVKKPIYKRWWFIALVVVFVMGGIGNLLDGSNDSNSEQPNSTTPPVEATTSEQPNSTTPSVESTTPKFEYVIIDKEDISTGNAVRYAWHVAVEGQPSADDLAELSELIIEDAKKEKSFNAITIGFYDYKEYYGTGYTLGKATFAPEGDWGKAADVKAGEYSKMDYSFELMNKDWSKQLSKEEVEIYKAWNDSYYGKATPSFTPTEEDITNEIAKIYEMKPEEVDQIFINQVVWQFDDRN